MQKKHTKAIAWVGAVITLIGVYALWQYMRKSKGKGYDQPLAPVPATSLTSPSPSSFPISKGSNNDYVARLQNALIAAFGSSILPKYGADGDWGSETDAAVKAKLNLTSVASESELNNIIKQLTSTATAQTLINAEIQKANLLISQFKANDKLRLMVTKNTASQEVKVDFSNAWQPTGNYWNITKNDPISRNTAEPYGVGKGTGMLLVKKGSKYYIFRPSNTTLV